MLLDVIRRNADAEGYLSAAIKACRSTTRSSLLKFRIHAVTSPISVSG
ncbi:hypothetical protein [Chlorogloeopsis sp. ULAP02]